jgi:O-antigen/teichoic acid export membrane protein
MTKTWLKYLPPFLRNLLDERDTMQKVVGNLGWLFADKIIRLGAGLFVGIWMARYLGPGQFGLLNFAIAFTALFSTFATLGLNSIVVRDFVREPAAENELLGTSFLLKLAGGLLTILLAVSVILLIRPGDKTSFALVGITSLGLLFQSLDVIDFWYQSRVESKYAVSAKNAAFLLLTLVKIVLILMKAPLVAFAVAGSAEIAVGVAGLLFVYRAHGDVRKWRASPARAVKLLRDSWPLILAGGMVAIYMKVDQVMLGEMISNEAVGIYSAALRVSEAWYFIPAMIVSSVFPAIVRDKEEDNGLYLKRILQLYTILIGIALSVAIPMTFLANHIIALLFGSKFSGAGAVLAIHIWTAVFIFYGVGKNVFIQCENMQLYSFIVTAVSAAVNVALNFVWISRYGVIGAALATLCAQITAAIILPSLIPKDRINVVLFFKAFVSLPKVHRMLGSL